ncbi:hypothetical protein B0H17DRAFT_1216113 [Mycena rosella]|uniref:Uncharacterized protein n=1 Tax=Mycena rosella TaxID=1033263 RepID=A0AAD7FZ79_MYCRO|nr:hypothetical protein B0H17DRAFT_1216113 [Mycena rosella]
MTTLSRHTKAVDKLIDINTRWKAAEKMLGPAIDTIPQLLTVPVILFVVGLLDSILSSVLALEVLPASITAASGLSLFFVAGVVLFLVFALADASIRPDSSPFQFTLSRAVYNMIPARYKGSNVKQMDARYYEIVQATHEDETLDKAAAALLGVLEYTVWYRPHHSHVVLHTLSHLISPEASIRCNLTAAQVIVHLHHIFRPSPEQPTSILAPLLSPLAQAATALAGLMTDLRAPGSYLGPLTA